MMPGGTAPDEVPGAATAGSVVTEVRVSSSLRVRVFTADVIGGGQVSSSLSPGGGISNEGGICNGRPGAATAGGLQTDAECAVA